MRHAPRHPSNIAHELGHTPLVRSLPTPVRAIVFGASGALGGAFVEALSSDLEGALVVGLDRHSSPAFELENEASIVACAHELASHAPYALMIDATGALTIDGNPPEKRLAELDGHRLARAFEINAIGPALLMKHFLPLLPAQGRCIFATLSARVGSIADNRKGGWYGYRASKAALNMLLQTAALETCRKRPDAVFLALQPGTVRSRLSDPFTARIATLDPRTSAALLLAVMDRAPATGAAAFLDHQGATVPW